MRSNGGHLSLAIALDLCEKLHRFISRYYFGMILVYSALCAGRVETSCYAQIVYAHTAYIGSALFNLAA